MKGDFRLGDRTVVPSTNRIVTNGVAVRVEPKAMRVLLHLAARRGEVAAREEIIRAVWPDTFVTDDVLKRCVSDLRRALGDDRGTPRFIETIPKVGYRLLLVAEPVEPERDEPPPAGETPARLVGPEHDVAGDPRRVTEPVGGVGVEGIGPRAAWWRRAALIVAGAVAMAAIGAVVMRLQTAAPVAPAPVAVVSLDVHPADELNSGVAGPPHIVPRGGSRTALAWTPDGRALVFVGQRDGVRQLYVRRLDAHEARRLPNTEGAQAPAVSPDGQWVAFWASGAIKKVPIGGGAATDLARNQPSPAGLVWDASGGVLFSGMPGPILQARGTTAPPSPVTTLREGDLWHVLPWPLPGGRALLYTVRKRKQSWGNEEVVAQTLATGARKVVLSDAVDARYLPTGHLVFLRRGVLFAVPFDLDRLEARGPPVAMLDPVAQALVASVVGDITGAGQFAIAPATGALAWIPSPVPDWPGSTLVTVDRQGRVTPLPGPDRSYVMPPRLSPDGRALLVGFRSLDGWGLALYDLTRGTLAPINQGEEALMPLWAPDGHRVVFSWLEDGRMSLAAQPVGTEEPPVTLLPGEYVPASFTPDGRQLIAVRDQADIVVINTGQGQLGARGLVETPAWEHSPELSPDGRWLAYGSDVSGRPEVYVRPFPGLGVTPALVSVDGGFSPAWHPNGRELFYGACDQTLKTCRMMAVAFAPGAAPRLGRPRPLFAFDDSDLYFVAFPVRGYDVSRDGQRFYTVKTRNPPIPLPPAVTHVNVVLNWVEELKARVPVK